MATHIAIVSRGYVEPILSGRKTVECRLTRTARAPFGRVAPGERIYLKQSSGPFFAEATVDAVYMADRLNAAAVDRLRAAHDEQIRGEAAFWRSRRRVARYATLIWLRDVRPIDRGPSYVRRHMVAWYVLDEDEDGQADVNGSPSVEKPGQAVGFEVTLTAGAVRNGYVSVPLDGRIDPACIGGGSRSQAGEALRLELAHGPEVHSDIVAAAGQTRGRFRWRGWAGWFRQCRVREGDRLRFVPRGKRRFRVEVG